MSLSHHSKLTYKDSNNLTFVAESQNTFIAATCGTTVASNKSPDFHCSNATTTAQPLYSQMSSPVENHSRQDKRMAIKPLHDTNYSNTEIHAATIHRPIISSELNSCATAHVIHFQ